MKRQMISLFSLVVLMAVALPGFSAQDKDAVMQQVAKDPVLSQVKMIGDVTPMQTNESILKIQKEALAIPIDSQKGKMQRVDFVRQHMMELSQKNDENAVKAVQERKEKQLLEEKLDNEKQSIVDDFHQRFGNAIMGATATDPDEYEPDNSHNSGTKLVDGYWTNNHTIAPAGDVDFYWFSGNAGDVIEFVTKTENPYWPSDGLVTGPADADLDPHLTLYAPDKSVLLTNDDGGAGWDAFVSVILPSSGIFYLSVEASPLNPSIGAYEIGMAQLKPDAAEVDNDMASATPIANFQTITGRTIMPFGDVDFYKFTAPVNYTSLKAAIANTPAALNIFQNYLDFWPDSYMHNLDPMIELYDAGGNLIWVRDDRIEPYDPELGFLDAELIYPTLMAGDYYLAVRHSGQFAGIPLPALGVGSYTLTLEMAFPDAYEFDNNPAHANTIQDGDVITDHTIIPMDWDLYEYQGTAGEFVEISVSTDDPCGRLDPILLLWTQDWENGTLLQPSWDQGPGLDSYILWGPLPYTGKYYFDVGPDMHIGYTQAEDVGRYAISLNVHTFNGGVPWNPANATPIAFNTPLHDELLARIGTYLPKNQFGGFMTTMPVWYKFDGLAGEQIGAKVTTPVQYRGLCPIWDNDWMDDLNPELYLVKLDNSGNPVIVAYNENINPNNLYDDAGINIVLPMDGTYYLVVQTDQIGPIVDPAGPLVQHSYGRYDIEVVRQPRVVDFDSDINVGHPPLFVNFFDHCVVEDDPVIDTYTWDAIYAMNVVMTGREPYYCYWPQGKHDVLKTGSNIAGSISELKEEFIQVYEPNGYAPMVLNEGVGDFVKETWDAAVDGDVYCWNGVATVKMDEAAGENPWASFAFADGKTKMINKVRIKTDAGLGNTGRWAQRVRVSAFDGIAGNHFQDILTMKTENGGWSEYVIDPPVKAAFLKLEVLDGQLGLTGWRQISEFEVYEDIVIPNVDNSLLSVTTPHLADGVDAAQITVKLVDDGGNPITVYDGADVKFYLANCQTGMFGPVDLSKAGEGIYSTTLTMTQAGAYQVLAVAHGAVIMNDIPGDNETPAKVAFFGNAGQKGELVFVEGSETSKGEGWDNAIDGDREGWDGTVTTKGDNVYAIFKFSNDMQMPVNKIGLATDNGFEDDAYEGRQVRQFKVMVSDDMVAWTTAFEGTRQNLGEMSYYTFPVVIGKYVKLVITQPDAGWRQLVEFEAIFDSKEGFAAQETNVAELPAKYELSSNYPNPFNPTTTINYQLPEEGFVTMSIYNMVGQKVATLVNGNMTAGYHSVVWNAAAMPSGVYLYHLEAGAFSETRRMVLLK